MIDDAGPRERERLFEVILKIAETNEDAEAQYAAFEGLNQIIVEYLADLESYPPAILTERIINILKKNHHIKQPKALFSLLRMIFGNRLSLTEEIEKEIQDSLKKTFKKISFEFMNSFWSSVFDFLQNSVFLSKTDILAPYLKKLKHLFKHREEIAPEVKYDHRKSGKLGFGIIMRCLKKKKRNFIESIIFFQN